jgi:hypothetical protein
MFQLGHFAIASRVEAIRATPAAFFPVTFFAPRRSMIFTPVLTLIARIFFVGYFTCPIILVMHPNVWTCFIPSRRALYQCQMVAFLEVID